MVALRQNLTKEQNSLTDDDCTENKTFHVIVFLTKKNVKHFSKSARTNEVDTYSFCSVVYNAYY